MIGRQERHSIEAFDERTGAYPVQAQLLLKAGAVDLAQTIADFPLEPFERDVPFDPQTSGSTTGTTSTVAVSISSLEPRRATPEVTLCTRIGEQQTSRSPATDILPADHTVDRVGASARGAPRCSPDLAVTPAVPGSIRRVDVASPRRDHPKRQGAGRGTPPSPS